MPEYEEPEPAAPFPYSSGKYDRDGYLLVNDAMEKSGRDFNLAKILADQNKAGFMENGRIEYYGMFEPWNLSFDQNGRVRD